MDKYIVKWRVRGSVVHPHYEGKETVFAEDIEDAENRARREVHRRAFQDLSIGSIEVISVEALR